MLDNSEHFLFPYETIYYSTIKVTVQLRDGRAAMSVLKIDDRELYELGRKPKEEDYLLKYPEDPAGARVMFVHDLNRWFKKADYFAEVVSSRITRVLIQSLEAKIGPAP